MGFFTKRERSELDKLRERTVHEFVPPNQEAIPRQPAPPHQEARPRREPTPHDIGPLLARASGYSLQQIDDLIDGLQAMRDRLNDEAERVQREMMAYARFSQTTLDSTKVISESLRNSFPSLAPSQEPDPSPEEPEQELARSEEATFSPPMQAALSASDEPSEEPGLGPSDDPMPAPSDRETLDPSEKK